MYESRDMNRFTLNELTKIIRKDWVDINKQAELYLQAMEQMEDAGSLYENCEGKKIISYFLVSAVGWKGDLARCIKKELNRRVDNLREINSK